VTLPTDPVAAPTTDRGAAPRVVGAPSIDDRYDPRRLLRPPLRRAACKVLAVALLVAAVCWFFGADVAHSILVGTAVTTIGLISLARTAGPELRATNWRGGDLPNWEGARRDVAELSSSLRGGYGRVTDHAVSRVKGIATQRLALSQLDLRDPADQPRIEQLIGTGAYAVLVWDGRRPPMLRHLLHCLERVEALGPTPPPAPLLRRRRPWSILARYRLRRTREQ
jgi:hypothetical protein